MKVELFFFFLFIFISNLISAYFKKDKKPFSFAWAFWIHIPVPFIILLRLYLGLEAILIPFGIFLAVLTQVFSSRILLKKS